MKEDFPRMCCDLGSFLLKAYLFMYFFNDMAANHCQVDLFLLWEELDSLHFFFPFLCLL